MLEVTNLSCTRGEHVLFSGLNFGLSAGELLQVQGENGSGKTTLLRTLCGFIQPYAGEVRWCGQPLRDLDEEYHTQMVYLGHMNAIKDDLSALENLRISSTLSGCAVDDVGAVEALGYMGLHGRETFLVKLLSQGQQRRVALARLLINKAPLWILDEPLAALDVSAVGMVKELIRVHIANQGMVIFTTHQALEISGVETRYLKLS